MNETAGVAIAVTSAIVILHATYGPATPADLVEEVRKIAASATFAGCQDPIATRKRCAGGRLVARASAQL